MVASLHKSLSLQTPTEAVRLEAGASRDIKSKVKQQLFE